MPFLSNFEWYYAPFLFLIAFAAYLALSDALTEGLDPKIMGILGVSIGWMMTKLEDEETPQLPKRKFRCFHCGKSDVSFRCQRCKVAWYCGEECQAQAWTEHKDTCIPFEETMAGRDGLLFQAKSWLDTATKNENKQPGTE